MRFRTAVVRHKDVLLDLFYRVWRGFIFLLYPYRDLSSPRYVFRDYDTWSLDLVLSRFIGDGLRHYLKVVTESSMGVASPSQAIQEWEGSSELQELHTSPAEYWVSIINEILWAMDNPEFPFDSEIDVGYPKYSEAVENYEERHANARNLLAKHWKDFWW